MTRTLRPSLLALALVAAAPLAQAGDLNLLTAIDSNQFRKLSEDLGSALSYKPLIPAESMGILGFDVGIAATSTKLENKAQWLGAFSGSAPSTLVVPSVRVHKGLPFDIDIGASLSAVPSSNIRLVGGELRWAALAGGTVTPAIAVRASVTSLQGVDQLKLRTTALDVSISKGFLMFTPYAGVGMVQVSSSATTSSGPTNHSFSQSKVFAGLNANFGLMNIAVEGDKTGDASTYGVKFGFRF